MRCCTSCGVNKSLDAFTLREGGRRDQVCNNCRHERRKIAEPEYLTKAMLRSRRNHAKKVGVPFDIELNDLLPLPATCPVLGIPISHGKGAPGDASPSIDRIIPHKGYVKGNVIVISNKANSIKSNATPDELFRVANYFDQLINH